MKQSKAQAAMEFMMTYGWALLVIVGAIAALTFLGILDFNKFLPDTCSFPQGFECLESAVISHSTNSLDFAVKNDYGFRINLTGVSEDTSSSDDCNSPGIQACTGLGCSPAAIPNGIVFDVDQKGVIRITCASIPYGRFKANVVLNFYSFQSGLTHHTTGQIRGQVTS
ncbi:hypothetical protein HYY72_03285 [Candidatus Woesearchaeota archaeon]|nr:hypothetical protein [Candidatus Woesearchaeota archaeon]